jgi:hypothetical protein
MSSTDTEFSWGLACLFYSCLPVLFCISVHETLKDRAEKLEQITGLPEERQRPLSIRHLERPKTPRSLFRRKEKQCLFLDQLPPEVRVMIYAEVLGDHVFRLERRKTNLGHITCHHEVESACRVRSDNRFAQAPCEMYGAVGGRLWPPKKKWKRFERDPDANLLGLAKTCKTM